MDDLVFGELDEFYLRVSKSRFGVEDVEVEIGEMFNSSSESQSFFLSKEELIQLRNWLNKYLKEE